MLVKKILKKMGYLLLTVIIVFVLATALVVHFYPSFGKKPSGTYLEKIATSPQHNGETFKNKAKVKESFTWTEYGAMISKMLKGNPNNKPPKPLPFEKWSEE